MKLRLEYPLIPPSKEWTNGCREAYFLMGVSPETNGEVFRLNQHRRIHFYSASRMEALAFWEVTIETGQSIYRGWKPPAFHPSFFTNAHKGPSLGNRKMVPTSTPSTQSKSNTAIYMPLNVVYCQEKLFTVEITWRWRLDNYIVGGIRDIIIGRSSSTWRRVFQAQTSMKSQSVGTNTLMNIQTLAASIAHKYSCPAGGKRITRLRKFATTKIDRNEAVIR